MKPLEVQVLSCQNVFSQVTSEMYAENHQKSLPLLYSVHFCLYELMKSVVVAMWFSKGLFLRGLHFRVES